MQFIKPIRFRFSPHKAQAAIHWMLQQHRNTDLHSIVKGCYFADKSHLNKYGRPIFGATYRAMPFGPVPLEIYEMAKGEAMWLPDLGEDHYPWELRGRNLHLTSNGNPNLNLLSETDREELAAGFDLSCSMTFTERTAATHGADWQAADMGLMAYEDMIDSHGDKDNLVAYLRETAPRLRL